jgi:cyclophilin family peptidyl-prolyl cis-trans isomerase
MKYLILIQIYLLTLLATDIMHAQTKILLKTTKGDIKIKLYKDTPLHSENFKKLVEEGFYDSLLFHRVISGFMIQAGDPESRYAQPSQELGSGGPQYTIPAEINSLHYHKKGALAAARLPDNLNPQKASSGSQFYIVQGKIIFESQLSSLENSGRHETFTSKQRKVYSTVGGAPHLDNLYTVFGEVIDGIEIIDSIASVPTDQRNRPISEIRILKALIIK